MRRIRAGAMRAVLAVTMATAVHALEQPASSDIEARINQAQAEGARFHQTRDNKAKDAARRVLSDLGKDLRQTLKRTPACETCHEQLVVSLFLNTYFGFAKNYEGCLEAAAVALSQFPLNGRIALYKGTAHYNTGQHAEAARALKRYAASSKRTPEADRSLAIMLPDTQQKFLAGWYNQANFYQSNESRIIQMNPQTFRNEVLFQFTPEYELQLGQQGFAQLSASAPVAKDPEVVAFLQQLVGRLVEKTPGPGFRYQVTLIDSPEVNAVTPPGHILVFTGLLRFVDTEAQLAGVLSHELAHNYGHHSARRLIKAYHGQQIGAAIARAVNPQTNVAQIVTNLTTNVGLDLFLKAYSRFEEKEADLYGAHLMFNAGYNPTAMSSFFLKLYQANPRSPVKFFATHPPPPDRADYLTDYLEAFPLDRELVVDSSDAFKQIKARYPSKSTAGPLGGTEGGIR